MKIDDPILAGEVARLKVELFDHALAGQGRWPPAARRLLDEHSLAAHTCGVLDAQGSGPEDAVAACRRDAFAALILELIETGTIARHDPLAAVAVDPPADVAAELAAATYDGAGAARLAKLDAAIDERRRQPYDGAGLLPTQVREGWTLDQVAHEVRNVTRPLRHHLRALVGGGADPVTAAKAIIGCDRLDAMADGIAGALNRESR